MGKGGVVGSLGALGALNLPVRAELKSSWKCSVKTLPAPFGETEGGKGRTTGLTEVGPSGPGSGSKAAASSPGAWQGGWEVGWGPSSGDSRARECACWEGALRPRRPAPEAKLLRSALGPELGMARTWGRNPRIRTQARGLHSRVALRGRRREGQEQGIVTGKGN